MAVDRVIHVGPPVGGLTDFPEHAKPTDATQALNCEFRFGGVSTRAGSAQIYRNFYAQNGQASPCTVKLVAPYHGATFGQMVAVGIIPLDGKQANSQRLICAFAESGEYTDGVGVGLNAPSFHAELTPPAVDTFARGQINFLAPGQIGDTVSVGGIVFTGAAAENIAAREYACAGHFTAEDSAASLMACINDAGNQAAIFAANGGVSAIVTVRVGASLDLKATQPGVVGELPLAVTCPIFYTGSVIVDGPLYGDEFVLGGITFTCGAEEDVANRVFAGGITSSLEDAAASLAACINDAANQAAIAAANNGASTTATVPVNNLTTILLKATVDGPDGALTMFAPPTQTGHNRLSIYREFFWPPTIYSFNIGQFDLALLRSDPAPADNVQIAYITNWVNDNEKWKEAYNGFYPIAVARPWGVDLMASAPGDVGWWSCFGDINYAVVDSNAFSHGETLFTLSGEALDSEEGARLSLSAATLVCQSTHVEHGAENRWDWCTFQPLNDVDPMLVVATRDSNPEHASVFITQKQAGGGLAPVPIDGVNRTDHPFHGGVILTSPYSDDPGTYVSGPISAKFCRPHQGRLVLGGIYPMRGAPLAGLSQLWYSNLKDPFGWATENIVDVAGRDMSELTGLGCWQNYIVVFRAGSAGLFRLEGYGNPTFREMVTGRGCASHSTIIDDVQGMTLFLSWDGLYGFNGSAEPTYLSKPIERRLRRQASRFPAAWSCYYPAAKQVWLGIPEGGGAPDVVYVLDMNYSPPVWSEFRYQMGIGTDARVAGMACSEDGRNLYGIKQLPVHETIDYDKFDTAIGDDAGGPFEYGVPFVSRYESGPIEYGRNNVSRWRFLRPVLRPTGFSTARFFWRKDSLGTSNDHDGQYTDQPVSPEGGAVLGSFVLGQDALSAVDDWQPRVDIHTGGTGRYGRIGVETIPKNSYDTFDLRGFEIDEQDRQARR